MAKKKAAKKSGPIRKVLEAATAVAQNAMTNIGLRRDKRQARRTNRRAKVASAVGLAAPAAKTKASKPAKKKAAKKAAAKPAPRKGAKKKAAKKKAAR